MGRTWIITEQAMIKSFGALKFEEYKKKQQKKEQAKENNMEKVDEIIELKKNVASMKAEMEEKDDRYKRIMAEFENYKKRSAKERETLYESIISEIVSSFLPVLDNLEKAVDDILQKYEKEKLDNRKQEILKQLEIEEDADKKKELGKELSNIIITLAKIK